MFCEKCGKETAEGTKCECAGAVAKDYRSYDYTTVQTSQKDAPQTIDCYECLGWELVKSSDYGILPWVTLQFKRNRKIKNKEQLTRIQVRLNDAMDSLDVMEQEKTKNATIWSLVLGIIGALIFGGGLCLFLVETFAFGLAGFIVGVVLGAIGAVVCGFAYPIYKKIRAQKTAQMNVLIEKKKDEIAQLCEDAQKLFN